MDDQNYYQHYADIAFENKQYMEALGWYKKILADKPDDLYALSRAGAISVSLGQFDLALDYFKRAKDLDSQNGDNHFNYANACFFKKDFANAFASYVDAKKLGCSRDVVPRLYYQMAMLCSLRQDVKSALIYFRKCEESDTNGELSLSPDLISEKLKLFMMVEDYSNAEKMAAQLVAIQPTLFRNYMVYYSVLMAHKNYDAAERLLSDAENYAAITQDDRINIILQTAALYAAKAETDIDNQKAYYRKAIGLLEGQASADTNTVPQLIDIILALAEIYQKADMHNKAVSCLKYILDGKNKPENVSVEEVFQDSVFELTPEEIDEMIHSDMERIREKINSGEIDGNMGLYSRMEYDEAGYPVNIYDETAFASLAYETADTIQKESVQSAEENKMELSTAQREKVLFMLLSSYLAMDSYEQAGKIADVLKYSNNSYYAYYGIYVSAFVTMKLCPEKITVAKKYAEAIAFFRNKMFSDHSDSLAAIFRARLYAEDGKTDKAREIAKLLAESDQKAVLDYIDSISPAFQDG